MTVRRNRRYYSNQWIAAAVYVVPEADSEFYQVGSSILGYDIRNDREVLPPLGLADIRSYVGEAAEYGFHATLADALLFATEAQIERLRAEVKFLSEEFRPFRLQNREVVDSPQDKRAIIVQVSDRSGTAEVIHHELVSRVYRSAISSSYLAGRTRKSVPDDDRARLLLDRYGSPYILNALDLHFTLCAFAPEDKIERSKVVARLARAVNAIEEREIEVEELALIVKRPGDERWRLEEVFPLCGPRYS